MPAGMAARNAGSGAGYIGIDEETAEVRAVGLTTGNLGDAPMQPELLKQVPPDQNIGSVTADGACDTRKCHDAIAARGAHAVIAPRKNARPCKPTGAGAVARNSDQCFAIPGPCPVATMERIPPQKPCQNEDALRETTGPRAS